MKHNAFVAIISDMHLAPMDTGTNRQQNLKDFPERRARHLTSVFDQLKQGPSPEAILFGGDNTNQPVSRSEYRQYGHDFMKRFQEIAPCYAIPGNHDVGSTAGWHHHDPKRLDHACAAFTRDWDEWWRLDVNGFSIIAVNTQIFGSGLPREKEQAHWLQQELTKTTANSRILFGHTPLYLQNPDDDFGDGSEQMCLKPAARKPLLDILTRNPPEVLLTTHAHRFWITHQNSWHWVGAPATALGQNEMDAVPSHNLPDGEDHVGWMRLWLDADGSWEAEYQYCCFSY